jgi:hypothetical protein
VPTRTRATATPEGHRAASRLVGAIAAVLAIGGCFEDANLPLGEVAAEERVHPATIVRVAPDRLLGVRIAPHDIAVIEFRPDDAGGYTSRLAVRSDLARPGRNSVLIVGSSAGSIMFGTATRDVMRVVVGELVESTGGDVANGVWLIWLPSSDNPMRLGWEFQRADGSIALGGSGQAVPDP